MKGTTVKVLQKTVTGQNATHEDIVTEKWIDVPDVLVGQPTTDDITSTLQLYGKRIEYVLGIPKGDTNDWTDTEVEIWGEKYKTIGYPMTGESENIPLRWGKNVKVERYG
ncbi:MAG: hypothetical protein J6Z09_07595 [Lachnospiraceae bacterium]|nr:hypothetical protein [Lachnospiraceae bacterium]